MISLKLNRNNYEFDSIDDLKVFLENRKNFIEFDDEKEEPTYYKIDYIFLDVIDLDDLNRTLEECLKQECNSCLLECVTPLFLIPIYLKGKCPTYSKCKNSLNCNPLSCSKFLKTIEIKNSESIIYNDEELLDSLLINAYKYFNQPEFKSGLEKLVREI